MEAVSFLRGEWDVISGAPFTFIIGAAILIGVVWTVAGIYYRGRIDTLKERIEQLKDMKQGPAKWG